MKITTWKSPTTGLWWGRIMATNGKQLARTSRGFNIKTGGWLATHGFRFSVLRPQLYKDNVGEWRWKWLAHNTSLISSESYKRRIDCKTAADNCENFLKGPDC